MSSSSALPANLDDSKQHQLLCEYCNRPIVLDPSFSKLSLRQYLNLQGLSSRLSGNNNHNGEDLEMLDPAELALLTQQALYPELGLQESTTSSGAASPSAHPPAPQYSSEPRSSATLPRADNAGGTADAAAQVLPPHPLQSQLIRDQSELLEAGITDRARNIRVTSYLFDLLSKKTHIKHPLCEECAEQLYKVKVDELKELEEECDAYKELLQRLQQQREHDNGFETASASPETARANEEELSMLKQEEAKLLKELEQLQREEATLRASEAAEERKLETLRAEDTRLLREYYAARRDVVELETEQMSIANQLDAANEQLRRLNATNALNLTFHIAHEGDYATINGLRLGRHAKNAPPEAQVDWDEVNAAFGQAALLLHTLARKLNFTFERFRVVPFGNWSTIEELEQMTNASNAKAPKVKSSLPLYHRQSRIFSNDDKFDKAVVSFSDCVWQLVCHMKALDPSLEFPFHIHRERIEMVQMATSRAPAAAAAAAHSAESSASAPADASYSLKCEKNDRWTFAMRCLLSLLKWIIAWVAARKRPSTVPGEQP